MRRLKIISLFILLILLFEMILPVATSIAATGDYLIKVGTGSYAITVTQNTTIQQIKNVLGEPKIQTESAFGGYAYTFYTDDNYNNYLYIETLSNGKIVSYGSVDPSYQTPKLSYGTENPYKYGGGYLWYGYLYYTDVIQAGVYYNSNLVNKEDFIARWESNPSLYNKTLSKHSITMYNALRTHLGNKSNLIFDEDLYEINEEFKKQNETIRSLFADMTILDTGKASDYKSSIGIRERQDLNNSSSSLMNPLMIASLVKNSLNQNFGEYNLAIFDYDLNQKMISAITLNEETKKYFNENRAMELLINKNEQTVQQSVQYAMSLLDDSMTDHEKAIVLAQYVQEGNHYQSTKNNQTYKGIFLEHGAVCAGYADAYKLLLNTAGIPCEIVTTKTGDHAWNLCYLDGQWAYCDTTQGPDGADGMNSGCNHYNLFFTKSQVTNSALSSLYYFGDAKLECEIVDELPEGTGYNGDRSYHSHVYYDENYKYYNDYYYTSSGEIRGLIKEDRKTGEKTLLKKSLVTWYGKDVGIVKNGSKIYYVGEDEKTIHAVNTDGTNDAVVFTATEEGNEIRALYVQDGCMYYSICKPVLRDSTEISGQYVDMSDHKEVQYLEMNDWPTIGSYTFNDDTHKYKLFYVESKDGITITQCVGLENNYPEGEIYIPETINGKKVIGIGTKAFYRTSSRLTGKLQLPSTIKQISEDAFNGCENIEGVVQIPEGVTIINEETFYGCNNIESIIFPSTIRQISNPLENCSSLEDILILSNDILYMNFGKKVNELNYLIHLNSRTNTSNYADSHQIPYVDYRTAKPTIVLEPLTLEMKKGDKAQIQYDITPKFFLTETITWQTTSAGVANVDNSGIVSAVGDGFATITIKVGNKGTANCKVTVKSFIKGDMDKSGEITTIDALLANEIFESGKKPSEEELQIGDINGDGHITTIDALMINNAFETKTTLE